MQKTNDKDKSFKLVIINIEIAKIVTGFLAWYSYWHNSLLYYNYNK